MGAPPNAGQQSLNFDAPARKDPKPTTKPPPTRTSKAPRAPEEAPVQSWPEPTRTSKMDLDFWQFHETNPAVYQALAELARAAVRQGKRRIGLKALWERVRWDMWLATEGDEDFNLNNVYTSRYARLLMAREVELRGVFALRRLRT